MSQPQPVQNSRIQRRSTGGITIKPTTKKEANEDEELLAQADHMRERQLKAAKERARTGQTRAQPRTTVKREFLDEDGNPIRRRINRDHNPFEIPKHLKKPGWDYEYKTVRVLGQTADPSEIVDYRNGGWRNAPAGDFKELCPPGWDKPFVERGGQVLMMRPAHLTKEAADEAINIAENQKFDKLKGALAGPAELGKVTRRIVTENKLEQGIGMLHPEED